MGTWTSDDDNNSCNQLSSCSKKAVEPENVRNADFSDIELQAAQDRQSPREKGNRQSTSSSAPAQGLQFGGGGCPPVLLLLLNWRDTCGSLGRLRRLELAEWNTGWRAIRYTEEEFQRLQRGFESLAAYWSVHAFEETPEAGRGPPQRAGGNSCSLGPCLVCVLFR